MAGNSKSSIMVVYLAVHPPVMAGVLQYSVSEELCLFHSVNYTGFPKAKNIGIATETCMELCDSFIEYKSHPVKMQKYQIQSRENTHFGELAATLKKTM